MPTEPIKPKKKKGVERQPQERQMLRPPVNRMIHTATNKSLRRCVEYDETHWPQRHD